MEAALSRLASPSAGGFEDGAALARALRHAAKAPGFDEAIGKLAPHVRNAVAWLGDHWRRLLPLVGLAA